MANKKKKNASQRVCKLKSHNQRRKSREKEGRMMPSRSSTHNFAVCHQCWVNWFNVQAGKCMKECIIEVYDNDAASNNLIQYYQINILLLVSCSYDERQNACNTFCLFLKTNRRIHPSSQIDWSTHCRGWHIKKSKPWSALSGQAASNRHNLLGQLISFRSSQ